jgi:hypothetical protein
MPKKSHLILPVAASLCAVLPAFGQVAQPDSSQPGRFSLPDGSGKQLVQQNCVGCHDLRRVVNSNYSPAEWRYVVEMMKAAGAPLSEEQAALVADYLDKSFPGKPKPAPVVEPGSSNVGFREWTVPTPGSKPHDPLATHDGAIWYTGQMTDKLGRLDPVSGRNIRCPVTRARTGSPKIGTPISGTQRISPPIRQARSEDRGDQAIQDAGSQCARPAYADF